MDEVVKKETAKLPPFSEQVYMTNSHSFRKKTWLSGSTEMPVSTSVLRVGVYRLVEVIEVVPKQPDTRTVENVEYPDPGEDDE